MNAVAKRGTETPTVAERISYLLPPVNIYESDEGYLLEADMPGVTKDGLEIYLEHNELTLIGRRSLPKWETAHYRESGEGEFRRVFELDPEIDTGKITARVENGVLTLNLAKREQVKPRKIAITD